MNLKLTMLIISVSGLFLTKASNRLGCASSSRYMGSSYYMCINSSRQAARLLQGH